MLSERDTDAFKKWYANTTLNHDDGSACYMAWCAALVEERKRAQRDAALKARVEAAEAALREIIDSIPSTYDENDPSVKRHARALNAGLKLIRRIDAALQAAREA